MRCSVVSGDTPTDLGLPPLALIGPRHHLKRIGSSERGYFLVQRLIPFHVHAVNTLKRWAHMR